MVILSVNFNEIASGKKNYKDGILYLSLSLSN